MRPAVPLDELPLPDRELYYKYRFLRDMPMKRFISSMGCPYPCTFCHEPVIRSMYKQETKSDYVRRKSVRRTVDEIKYIADRYPLKHVHFSDDLFFIRNSYKWLEEFAEVYPKEVGIPWNCNIRYDSVQPAVGRSAGEGDVLRRGGRPRVGQSGNPRESSSASSRRTSTSSRARGCCARRASRC